MSTLTAPIKTPLGEEELRGRTLRLSQRHRTILLLVDGHRPLDEVLSLASQAGAASSHLDELVKLGLVRLPVVETETPPHAQEHPTADDRAKTAAVLLDPEVPPAASAALPAQALDEQAAQPVPAQAPSAPASRAAAVKPRGKSRRKPAVSSATLEPLPADALQPAPKPSADKRRRSPASRPAGLRAAPAVEVGDPTLQQVRELLVDTLRLDTPQFSARMLVKVHGAQSADELIDLVWEIQTHLRHDRHSHNELQSLHKARELLGMGNTHVDGESQAGALDE